MIRQILQGFVAVLTSIGIVLVLTVLASIAHYMVTVQ